MTQKQSELLKAMDKVENNDKIVHENIENHPTLKLVGVVFYLIFRDEIKTGKF